MASINDAPGGGDSLNKRVRTLIRTLLGMPANSIRPANQNAPAGAIDEQFATVLIMTIGATGQDERFLANEAAPSKNVVELIGGQRKFVASVQFFRGDAYTKAMRLEALLSTSKAVDLMQQLGIGFVDSSPPRNLTGVVNTLWEERGQIDLTFYVIAAEATSIPTYGTFPISFADGVSPTQAFEVKEP